MERKFLDIKSEDVNDKGEFSGIASFYGNKDLGGDIVIKGVFDETLKR